MWSRPALIVAALTASLSALPAAALAAGNGTKDKPECKSGQVYSQVKGMCVNAQSGLIDDKSLADYAYRLAQDGRYEEALATLDLMRNPHTAEALNYRGYATRNLGRVEEVIRYYRQAVALDPGYTLVREYLGEAYVIQGRLDLAREQLGEIGKLCGTTCGPYVDLAEVIADET